MVPVSTWENGQAFDGGNHPLEGEVGYILEVPPNFPKIKKKISHACKTVSFYCCSM